MKTRLMKQSKLVFTRTEPNYYDDNGRPVEGLKTYFDAEGSLQPLKAGKDTLVLPEGVLATESYVFYTGTKLNTADQYTKSLGDITSIGGRYYTVFSVADYSHTTLSLGHYKAVLIRQDNTGVR